MVGLSEVPSDPFSGQAFMMRAIDGKPIVYSVGPDENDDQGRSTEGPVWQVYRSNTLLVGDVVFSWQD